MSKVTYDPSIMAQGLLEFGEQMQPMQDWLDGQREDYLRRGYSAVAAEQMVVEMMKHLLWMVRGAKPGA